MKLRFETSEPNAFIALSEAMREIIAFRERPEARQHLETATDRIHKALSTDPDYGQAIYYDAILDDLSGRSVAATEKYERVLELTKDNPALANEVRYNLGVAYYHGYSWPYLDQAIVQFDQVLDSTRDTSLKALSLSARAQAFAMHVIPPKEQIQDASKGDKVVLEQLAGYARRGAEDANRVLKAKYTSNVDRRRPPSGIVKAARWAALNASGMRKMYLSDYWGQFQNQKINPSENLDLDKEQLLRSAIKDLDAAERERPGDWANWCDLGSAYMRLGVGATDKEKASEYFERATKCHLRVVKELRPKYGFALYELGRIARLSGHFQRAIEYLNQAKQIPYPEREVGDKRVDFEIARAVSHSVEYP
jgi:tetratricopeptide (TPR) repeat protein